MSTVCVDASFALKAVLAEPGQPEAAKQFESWRRARVALITPWLFLFETHSVLWRKMVRGELTDDEARQSWRSLRRLGMQTVHPRRLFDRAWTLAGELTLPVTYDAVYAAVADLRGCELWTADQRLVNAAAGKVSWIRSL